METREEKLATWADPSINRQQRVRILTGSLSLGPNNSENRPRLSEGKIQFDQIENCLLNTHHDDISDGDGDIQSPWQFQVVSLPRLRPGRLVLSIPKQVFEKIQGS